MSAAALAGGRASGSSWPRGSASRVSRVAGAEDEADRRAKEAPLIADAVLQRAAIAEVDQLRIVDEDHEGRRRHRHLRGVQNLPQPIAHVRRRVSPDRIGHYLVEV